MPITASRHGIPSDEYDRIFAVLDECSGAATLNDLKHRLMDALHSTYHFPNTTFLTGPTFRGAFADPDPVTAGRITPIIDEYKSLWYRTDMFASSQSFAALSQSHAIAHSQLQRLSTSSLEYLDRFLHRRKLHSAAVMHLELADRCHGLVGIFDSAGSEVPDAQLRALGLLAGQLSTHCRAILVRPGTSV